MYNFSSFALAQLLDAVTNNDNNNNNKKKAEHLERQI